MVAQKIRAPGDDLLSTLLAAEVDGERPTERDLDNLFSIFVIAGNGAVIPVDGSAGAVDVGTIAFDPARPAAPRS